MNQDHLTAYSKIRNSRFRDSQRFTPPPLCARPSALRSSSWQHRSVPPRRTVGAGSAVPGARRPHRVSGSPLRNECLVKNEMRPVRFVQLASSAGISRAPRCEHSELQHSATTGQRERRLDWPRPDCVGARATLAIRPTRHTSRCRVGCAVRCARAVWSARPPPRAPVRVGSPLHALN